MLFMLQRYKANIKCFQENLSKLAERLTEKSTVRHNIYVWHIKVLKAGGIILSLLDCKFEHYFFTVMLFNQHWSKI